MQKKWYYERSLPTNSENKTAFTKKKTGNHDRLLVSKKQGKSTISSSELNTALDLYQ